GTEQAANREADDHLCKGYASVKQQMADVPHAYALGSDRRRRRDDERRNPEQARTPLPTGQKQDQQHQAGDRAAARRAVAFCTHAALSSSASGYLPISRRSISLAT